MIRKYSNIIIFTILTINTSLLYAADNLVAKVIILKGAVKAKLTAGSIIDVKMGQDIPEGALIQTADKSFVKLIFIDKSQMNLGPNSQMTINAFPKKEAGIITLVKGQLRSQVTKDYMEMDDKSKSKLYIKTTTAAMGIRGTDFQVNYNPENQNTSLITFEGAVAMSHIDRGSREERFDQKKLEEVVANKKAVLVTGGHISAVNLNVSERAMEPTKLAPNQIEALKINETGIQESSSGENKDNSNDEAKVKFRNPIPPGTEGSIFSNNQNDFDKALEKVAGDPNAIKTFKDQEKTNAQDSKEKEMIAKFNGGQEVSAEKVDPKGFFNAQTGEYKLPAGSIIDLKSVNIIPPPINAVFDINTKTFQVPENFGKIDTATGNYKAPEGLKLSSDGKFKIIDPETFSKNTKQNTDIASNNNSSTSGETNRGPASVPAMDGTMKLNFPTDIYATRPDLMLFAQKFAPVILDKNPILNDNLRDIAQTKIMTTENVNQNNTNLGTTTNSTKLTVKFSAE